MSWKQVTNFDLNKMGTTAGMCLQNVRLGYSIAPKYASARDAMNASKARGTFHEGLNDIPQDVDVPLYAETGSPYAHIMVDVHGAVYSDGKYVSDSSWIHGDLIFGHPWTKGGRYINYDKYFYHHNTDVTGRVTVMVCCDGAVVPLQPVTVSQELRVR